MKTKIGKIRKIKFGYGGHDGAMWGVTFEFGSDTGGWGVTDFWGFWAFPPSSHAKWTDDERLKNYGDTSNRLLGICETAKVKDINDLVDIPVEIEFENNTISGWRILEEVI